MRLTDVLHAATRERLLNIFSQIVSEAGGTGFAVALLPSATSVKIGHDQGLNGYTEYYEASGFVRHCPVTRQVAATSSAFRWNDVRVADDDRMGRAVLHTAHDFGIVGGLLVPMHARDGQKGCVFVHMPEAELVPPTEQWLTMLCMAFHSRLMELGVEADNPETHLSAREREVLCWMAEGKSAEDVAEIMGISAATVMFHYRNVAVRFGTLNRTHTVVEAMRRGVLAFG